LSKILSQVIRLYGVKAVQRLNHSTDDFILVVESLINTTIVFFAIIFFAQSQDLNLMSVLAGLGIVGLAVPLPPEKPRPRSSGQFCCISTAPICPVNTSGQFQPQG
jgi:MscS family membrane protein